MNASTKKTLIALAVATLFGSSMAYASEGEGHDHHHSKIDSAAIASVDNSQSVTGNVAGNDKLSNTSTIKDRTAARASGNIGMNVAAGDNNAQDNAAALAATDASFTFGMADSEVYVGQSGMGNLVVNQGVTNSAGVTDNAFRNASGNIGVNVASGNNNEQKNALAAAVATTKFAHAGVDANQVSSGNVVSNAGRVERYDDTTTVRLRGTVSGYSLGFGIGGYEGSTSGSYSGSTSSDSRGNAYQASNLYPDSWTGDSHPGGFSTGHVDFDSETQGAVQNPYRPGVGGLGFDTDSHSAGSESGSMQGSESGLLGFAEISSSELFADLCGTVTTSRYVVVDATNDASLSGNAFQNATGNIGVNVASGTGNLQANSLSMAVAQPTP
ncbi:adhesin [Frateuria soli]|uniref:adhesin n=1 Tax=Frateuria soli TaxID=1542730 RepID=UPI001E2A91F9|nr:adhesin [Frateuria soli]UGB37728.1 adhesin [Frateuria soli]